MEEVLVDDLFNGERDARIQAATQVGKLGRRQKQNLVDRGIMAPLVSMLHSQDNEAIEAALSSLLSLAFGSERNKIGIVKSGAVPMLLQLLQCRSERLVELTVASLLILSSCTANKLAIASSGAIQLLVEILLSYDSGISLQSKLDAIVTLHNLSTCHQVISSIVSSGVIYSLIQLIQTSEKSSELAEKAIALIENIVTLSGEALQEIAAAGGAIRALVEMIEEGSPRCREHAVAVLLLICQSCREKYRTSILREGVMPGLLQLSAHGAWRAKNMAQELLLLLRDCSTYGSRIQHFKHELVEQIMQEIDAEGDQVSGTTLRLVEQMIAKLSTR